MKRTGEPIGENGWGKLKALCVGDYLSLIWKWIRLGQADFGWVPAGISQRLDTRNPRECWHGDIYRNSEGSTCMERNASVVGAYESDQWGEGVFCCYRNGLMWRRHVSTGVLLIGWLFSGGNRENFWLTSLERKPNKRGLTPMNDELQIGGETSKGINK